MASEPLIYLDHNATTPVAEEVLEKMLPYFSLQYGNASSRSHPFGWRAESAVATAREQIARALRVEEREIVFTSGATESINLAIKGVCRVYRKKGNHIIAISTEHKAVLDVCESVSNQGVEVTYMPVDNVGAIDLADLEGAIRPDTLLIVAMWANNETGTILPMRELGAVAAKHDVILMSDATQAVGKMEVHPAEVGVHLLAFSGHKLYGPKGVGGLYVARKPRPVKIAALIEGGGHEGGYRSGTLNVPGIVGLGAAVQLATTRMGSDADRLGMLRDRLEKGLLAIEATYLNAAADERLSHVTNISFKYVESEALIATCNQVVAVSTGSACTSATLEPSHVLLAQGQPSHMAHSAIRFSLGRGNTVKEVDRVIALISDGVARLRAKSPVWQMYKQGIDVDSLL